MPKTGYRRLYVFIAPGGYAIAVAEPLRANDVETAAVTLEKLRQMEIPGALRVRGIDGAHALFKALVKAVGEAYDVDRAALLMAFRALNPPPAWLAWADELGGEAWR